MISPVRLSPRQVVQFLPLAFVAAGTLLVAALFVALRDGGGAGQAPRLSGASEWAFIAGTGAAGWLAGTRLRKTRKGLQVLLAWAAGLTLAGLALVANGPASLAAELRAPATTAAEVGRWAMLSALGPLAAAWALDYRRSDWWYILPFALAGAAWLAFAWPIVPFLDQAF